MAHGLALSLHGITHRYGLAEVLAGVDLALARGEVLALVGPSGCGKTTLLNLVAGFMAPSAGRIVNGCARLAYVFQQPRLLPWQRARDNIALGLKAMGVPRRERRQRAEAMGRRLGLAAADLDKYPHQLSGGMQSRVALARAFVLEPDLLLLDEPFAALDVGLKHELYGLLERQLDAGATSVLLITHDLMEAVRLADRVLVMAAGRIVATQPLSRARGGRDEAWVYQTTAHLLARAEVRRAFGLPPPDAAASAWQPRREAA